MQIRKGTNADIEEVSALYDAICGHLETHTNTCGWRQGVYPAREDAAAGIEEQALWVAEIDGRIAGTLILRHTPEEAYALADWGTALENSEILVLYTFAVHPDFLHQGVGRQMLEFVLDYAARENMKAVRLYEQMGFRYVDTVDLGYSAYGLDRFRLYQRML